MRNSTFTIRTLQYRKRTTTHNKIMQSLMLCQNNDRISYGWFCAIHRFQMEICHWLRVQLQWHSSETHAPSVAHIKMTFYRQ